jgi:hypothetical protein
MKVLNRVSTRFSHANGEGRLQMDSQRCTEQVCIAEVLGGLS